MPGPAARKRQAPSMWKRLQVTVTLLAAGGKAPEPWSVVVFATFADR